MILTSRHFSQQVSSLNCVQWSPRRCTTYWSNVYVEMWMGYILHTIICIHFVWILYAHCIIVLMMFTICRSKLMHIKIIYKMYTKCIPHFNRLLYIYILYTNFSCHSSFNFVYKRYAKVCQNVGYIFEKFCIHQLYKSCTIFVQMISVWVAVLIKWCFTKTKSFFFLSEYGKPLLDNRDQYKFFLLTGLSRIELFFGFSTVFASFLLCYVNSKLLCYAVLIKS